MKQGLRLAALFLLGLPLAFLALLEFEVRRSGLGDRPRYHADAQIGYIPLPSQHGQFENRLAWSFNERSMRTDAPFHPDAAKRDILLIGDSVVFGWHGNAATIAPALARETGARVWPIAAPSWGLANELTYLEDNPDVAQRVDDIVFVVNKDDFGPASYWINEYRHPTHDPVSYAAFWLGLQFLIDTDGDAIPVIDRGPLGPRVAALRTRTKARLLFLYYPTIDALDPENACFDIPAFLRGHAGYCLAMNPDWSAAFYEDGVHPLAAASPKVARVFASALAIADANRPAPGFFPARGEELP